MIPSSCPQNPNLPRDERLCLANIEHVGSPCSKCEHATAIAEERMDRLRRGYVRSH